MHADTSGGELSSYCLQLYLNDVLVATTYSSAHTGYLQWLLDVPVDGAVHIVHATAASLANYKPGHATNATTTLMIKEL